MLRLLAVITVCASAFFPAAILQEAKSGPQRDQMLPGTFQPLNINGSFAGRHHCLICEFRLNPVALVFVRAQSDGVDPEVKGLLEALDKAVQQKHADTGLESFVVFLSSDAQSGVSDDQKEIKDKAGYAKAIAEETVKREKLVNTLKEFAQPFKRLVVTCYPPEPIGQQFNLAPNAEVTVVLYAKHRVLGTSAFAEGQLKQEGVANVIKGVEAMLATIGKSGR